jgi:hypothetical protein
MGVFLVGATMAIAAFGRGAFSAWWLVIPAVLLMGLGSRLQRAEAQAAQLSRAVQLYERALARLDGQWAGGGETGARFLDERHLYAQDLDILGEASLFEFLCTARTPIGEETLAGWLLHPAPSETVAARQGAILELAPRLNFREDLALAGDTGRSHMDAGALITWGEREPAPQASLFRGVAWGVSVIGAIAIALSVTYLVAILGIADLSERTLAELRIGFLTMAIVCFGAHWRFKRRTSRIIQDVDTAAHDLGVLAAILQRLETEEFSSPYLAALRVKLTYGRVLASAHIARLHRLIELLELRRSQIIKIIDPFVLWSLHLCDAVEDWRRTSGPALRQWVQVIGEMEAIASLASYSYEHPNNVFPELVTASPLFQAEGLGHPLLPADFAVPNDVCVGTELRVLVVSGSNMSGKSTLLRTIGTNAVLAQAGAPVCARRLRLSPLAIGASIRIQDSLHDGTSRFYAEISRLSRIMELSCSNPPVLFLIDEFLQGTNSHDRLIGAEAIVRGFVDRGAIGLITTHDLALTHIADAIGSRGANVHFQDYLEHGQLRFDYRLRSGVVQHSNALELMRSVGLHV